MTNTSASNNTLSLKVLFFAASRERAGRPEQVLEVSAPCTLQQLKERLYQEHPRLKELNTYLRWAINERFEPHQDRALNDGDVIALIPPISGG